jgi:hypothetical protein
LHSPNLIGTTHAKNGQKRRSAVKNMRSVRKTVRLAQKMGKGLGERPLLF